MIAPILTPSQLKHLDENYSPDQVETVKKDKHMTKFVMREAHYYCKDNTHKMSEYIPSEMLSKDPDVVRNWVKSYFTTGKTQFKLHKQDTICEITERDIDTISKFLQGGVIQVMERYQSLSQYDYDYIHEVYKELMEIDNSPFESVTHYFKTFFDNHFNSESEVSLTSLQSKWKIVMDCVVSEIVKEIIIKWVDYNDSEDNYNHTETIRECELIDIKIIDLDTKSYKKIPRYPSIMFKFFVDYLKWKFNR